MAASHFLPSGPNSATPIRRRIGARIRTGRNACRPASSSNPSAVPSASLHTPPLLSQAVRRNAHMTPIRRSCPVSLRRPARVRSKELAGSDRVGPLYRLFRSAFGSGSAHPLDCTPLADTQRGCGAVPAPHGEAASFLPHLWFVFGSSVNFVFHLRIFALILFRR